MRLDEIGKRHGTDKASGYHNYLNFYESYLSRFADSEIKLLEIGVLDGASLRTWEEFFPSGAIVGADINPTTIRFARGRIAMEILDQSNLEELVALGVKHGPFDIIIEDGSHNWEHQITSLRTLFPFLKSGGIFVLEDLQTNYGALAPIYKGISSKSCMEYLKEAADLCVAHEQININAVEDAFLRTYAKSMSITFARHCCLIQKTYSPVERLPDHPGAPLVQTRNSESLIVTAHFGNVGDVMGQTSYVSRADPGVTIQGFSILTPGETPGLEYRGRLADGSWTPWASDGGYVGTKGEARALLGFSARLKGAGRSHFKLKCLGLFVGHDAPVEANGGSDVVSKSGDLRGIQLVLHRTRAG